MTLMISRMGAIMKEDFMETKVDHTPAIFAVLGITPETQHEWYIKSFRLNCTCRKNGASYSRFCSACKKQYKKTDKNRISLLSGTLEADGLAVRLVEIASGKIGVIGHSLRGWSIYASCGELYTCVDNTSFAHAVHDALVEALGITDKEEKENE